MVETIAWGFGLVEGPTVTPDGSLYVSDVLGGGVVRLSPDGERVTVVPKRRGVGGIALHADGGIVISGRDVLHVTPEGANRTLLAIDGLPGFNDLGVDPLGRVLVGAVRFFVFDPASTPVPGELWRIDGAGEASVVIDDVLHPNGVAVAPDGRSLWLSDTRRRQVVLADLDDSGAVVAQRRIDFPGPGHPDGLAFDVEGGVWIASAGGGEVIRFTADGTVSARLTVPARVVTSCCFAGTDLVVVSADNTEAPERGGSVFRCAAGVAGAPVPLVRI